MQLREVFMWGTADSYPQVEAGVCCNKRYTFCYRGRKITHIGSDLRFCVFLMVAQRCLALKRVSVPKALVECRLYGGRRPTCPRVTKGIPFVTAAAGKSGAPGPEIGKRF